MSKVPCYLRTLRRQWSLTQAEVASLLPKGDRNRVRDVEQGRTLPNASEILAYSVIFGASGSAVFPRYFADTEDIVMRRAYRLFKKVKRSGSPRSTRKLELLRQMLARARRKPNRKRV